MPASEIIHDQMDCLFPSAARGGADLRLRCCRKSGAADHRGSRTTSLQTTAPAGRHALGAGFHILNTAGGSRPVGTGTSPGNNASKIAALGDGLKYEPCA